jgi:thiol-disulfide isomerase/thioredoxin
LNCQNQERVRFWAEDEDLIINFRGRDTARVHYIGPTYVHIYGGPNNELINLFNWENYLHYWTGASASNVPYKTPEITDKALVQDISGKILKILNEDHDKRIAYLVQQYGDRNSIILLLNSIRNKTELHDEVIARLERKNPDYPPLVKYKAQRIEEKELKARLEKGQPAPDFSYPTPNGKENLGPHSFKGKFLIIDFWASWCGPCRMEIPNLKKDYETYRSKGVEILSVSIDKDESAWRKAMKEEDMPWSQVLAPDTGKDILKTYQFSAIPHIVLLDKEGKIIGENFRGKILTDKLEELTNTSVNH